MIAETPVMGHKKTLWWTQASFLYYCAKDLTTLNFTRVKTAVNVRHNAKSQSTLEINNFACARIL